MKKNYFFLTLILMTIYLFIGCKKDKTENKNLAAPPSIQWQKTFGGTGVDEAYSIQQTTDGGYIIAGATKSTDGDVIGSHDTAHNDNDYWVLKINNTGAIEWQKCLGGTTTFGGSSGDYATSIQQTTDGGYIVAGYSASHDGDVTGNHGNYDYWVVKLNGSGNIEWQKSLGGAWDEWAPSIEQTSDGGYIVAGYSGSNDGDVTGNHGLDDYCMMKLNNTGNFEWQKSLGGTQRDYARSIHQTNDGGYIVAGTTNSNDGDVSGNHGKYDYWTVKLNGSGNLEWQKSLGGTQDDIAYSIQQTADGGFIVAGYSGSNDGDVTGNHGDADCWIVKLNSTGTIDWEKSIGGTVDEVALSIVQTSDGGYLIGGSSESNDGDVTGNHGNEDFWIVKLNSTGIIEWQKSLGGTASDFLRSMQQTSDGGFILAGTTFSNDGDVTGNHGIKDYWIVKLAP